MKYGLAACAPTGNNLKTQTDPGVAIDNFGGIHMMFLGTSFGDSLPAGCGAGLDPVIAMLYARSYDSGETWETGLIPGSQAGTDCWPDKGLIAADRRAYDPFVPGAGRAIYAAWTRNLMVPGISDPMEIWFAASDNFGANFIDESAQAKRLSFRPNDCHSTREDCKIGAFPAVGPSGEVHVIWEDQDAGEYDPDPYTSEDAIDIRSTWDMGETFVPSIAPPTPNPEDRIVVYNPVQFQRSLGAVADMTNFDGGHPPSLAVDNTFDCDHGGRGGRVYVVFAHEEFTDDDHADSNIYLARSRSIDPVSKQITWADPVRVNDTEGAPVVCTSHSEGTPATRYDIQFMPTVAVDDEGHVGVMWYDTRNDPAPCNDNIVFDVYFSYSIDGGENFEPDVRITDQSLESWPTPTFPRIDVSLREYVSIAARDNVFHLVWTDVRKWSGYSAIATVHGDIFTAKVIVYHDVIRMGDYNRDGEVDDLDEDELGNCEGPDPTPQCEIFDFDMDGDVDYDDICAFYLSCWSNGEPPYVPYCPPDP